MLEFSIVVGRVSTEDQDRVLQLVQSLFNQTGSPVFEVIIVDRLHDKISETLKTLDPRVIWIGCPSVQALPAMRQMGLLRSRHNYVIVTEDHCVPTPDWLQSFSEVLREHPEAVAVGGAVLNGIVDRTLDWATFLCEYAACYPPLPLGASGGVVGMNVAYQRQALLALPQELLSGGFWETTVHPRFVEQGRTLVTDNRILLHHSKRFSLGLFTRQRYIYSRYFAGIRFRESDRRRRYVAALACVLLPGLLVCRLLVSSWSKPPLRQPVVLALPYLLWFYLAWAVGECVGYLAGPADSLQRIE